MYLVKIINIGFNETQRGAPHNVFAENRLHLFGISMATICALYIAFLINKGYEDIYKKRK